MDDRTQVESSPIGSTTTDELLRQIDLDQLTRAESEVSMLRARLGAGDGPEPGLVTLADVEPECVAWLWPGRVPRGKLTVLEGDPGLGKSTLALDLAARLTTGRPLPDGLAAPEGDVILLTAEDGLADTVRPRFDALGGDPRRVWALQFVREASGDRAPVSLPEHVAVVRSVVARRRAILVVVDPLMAYLESSIDSFKDHDVRRSLAPLAQLAEESGAAVLLVRHLNKAAGGSALYRGGGSIGIIGAARSGLLVARDPDDDARRVLAVVKSNLAAAPPSLTFTVEGAQNGASRIAWGGESPHRADQLVSQPPDEDERHEAQDLQAFIRELAEATPRTQREAMAAIRAAGFTAADRSVRRARRAAGVTVQRQGFGPGSTVVWVLNGHTGHIPAIGATPAKVSGMASMGQYDEGGRERVPGKGDAYEGSA